MVKQNGTREREIIETKVSSELDPRPYGVPDNWVVYWFT